MMLVGVLVVMLDRRVEAAPHPEREHASAEDRTDYEREQKLHHGIDLDRPRALAERRRLWTFARGATSGAVEARLRPRSAGVSPASAAGRRSVHGSSSDPNVEQLTPRGPGWQSPQARRNSRIRPPCRKGPRALLACPARPGEPHTCRFSFDPFSPAWRDDPYPKYRELRDSAPVHWSPEAKVWCVSRYDDVMNVLRSHDAVLVARDVDAADGRRREDSRPSRSRSLLFAARCSWKARINPFALPNVPNLIAEDGERHSLMRAIVNRGFTPRQIAAWEPRVREIVAACMAPLRRGEPSTWCGISRSRCP